MQKERLINSVKLIPGILAIAVCSSLFSTNQAKSETNSPPTEIIAQPVVENTPNQLVNSESTKGTFWHYEKVISLADEIAEPIYFYPWNTRVKVIKYSRNVTAVGNGFEALIPIGEQNNVDPHYMQSVSEDWFEQRPDGSYSFKTSDFLIAYGDYFAHIYHLFSDLGYYPDDANVEYRVILGLDPQYYMKIKSDLLNIFCIYDRKSVVLIQIRMFFDPINNPDESLLKQTEYFRLLATHESLHSIMEINNLAKSKLEEALATAFSIDYYASHPVTPLYDKNEIIQFERKTRAKDFYNNRNIGNTPSRGYEHHALVSQLMRIYQVSWPQIFERLKTTSCAIAKTPFDEMLQLIFPEINLEETYIQYLGQALLDPGVGDADLFDHIRQMRQDDISLLEIGYPYQQFTLQPGEFNYIAFDTTSIKGNFTPQLKMSDELLAGMLIDDEQRIVRVHNGTLFREKDEPRHVGFVIYNHGESEGTVVMTAFDLRSLKEKTLLPNISK